MVDEHPNRVPIVPWLTGYMVVMVLAMTVSLGCQRPNSEDRDDSGELTELSPTDVADRFVTTIRRPSGPPTIELQQTDPQGRTGEVSCSTCHSVRESDFTNRTPADLDLFHQNMSFSHGKLSCYACHNPGDADTLRLADTTVVTYPDVMTLCGQCHGTQARDYAHGAHGGMNGYWDLSRGPRSRNNCIDCHDPHVPKFPSMKPTFKPRDRFLDPPLATGHRGES